MTCCSFTSWPCFSTRSAFSLSKSTGGSDSPGLLSRPCCPFRIYGDKEEKFIKGLCIQCGRNPITGLQDAVNQLLFATNLFHKLLYINWFALINFLQSSLIIYTYNVRTTLEQGLVRGKRYLRWRGSRKPCKNVSNANKSLFKDLHGFNLGL